MYPVNAFLKDLTQNNRDKGFRMFYQQSSGAMLVLGTVLCILVSLGYHLIGAWFFHIPEGVFPLYWMFFSAAILINFLLSRRKPGVRKSILHLIVTFYICAAYLALNSIFLNQEAFSNWTAIHFLLVVWFVFLPLGYLSLMFHGLLVVIVYYFTVWCLGGALVLEKEVLSHGMLMSGVYFAGSLVAIFTNYIALRVYRNEKSLRLVENHYRILTENMMDVVWTLDIESRKFTYCSPSVEKLCGYTDSEIIRLSVEDTLETESAKKITGLFPTLLENYNQRRYDGSLLLSELQQKCKDGGTVWIEVSISFIPGPDGKAKEIMGVSRDISARKKAEQALQKSEESYKDLIQNANDGICITQDGVFKMVNKAFCEITGYEEDELIGMPFIYTIEESHRDKIAEIHKQRMAGNEVPKLYHTVGIGKYKNRVELEFNTRTMEFDGKPASFLILRDITFRRMATEALRESEEKYKALVERANDGIVILQDGYVRFINQMMAKILGYTVEEMLNTRFVDYLPADQHEPVLANYKARQLGREVNPIYESALLDKLGNRKEVEFNSAIISYKGRPATQTYIRDITSRVQAEQKLRESEERFRMLISSARDSIVMIDSHGAISYWNPASKEIFGYSAQEVLGKSLHDVITPDPLRENYNAYLSKFVKGEISIPAEGFIEATGKRKTGEEFLYELSLWAFSLKGAWAGVGYFRDISSRKKAEQALKISQDRYLLAVEGVNDGIFDWDLLNNTVFFSRRYKAIIGYGDDEISNNLNEWESRIHPDDHAFVMKTNNDFINGLVQKLDIEYRIKHKDGSYRWILSRGVCLRDKNGRAYRVAGSHMDITERKKAELDLRESQERFAIFMDNLPAAVFIKDVNGKYIYTNRFFKETLYNGDLFGKTSREFLPVEMADKYDVVDFNVFTTGKSFLAEETIYTIRGEQRTFQNSRFIIHRSDGQPLLGAIAMDITDKKLAEKLLADSEVKYRTIFNTAGDAIFLTNRKTHRIMDANESSCRMYGYSLSELLQLQCSDLIVDNHNSNADGFIGSEQGTVLEQKHRKKSGEEFYVEISSSCFYQNSEELGIALVHDITERKGNIEALRESETKFREITDLLPQLIYEIDTTGRVTFLNRTGMEIYGFTQDDIEKGIFAPDFFIAEDRERLIANYNNTMKSGKRAIAHEYSGKRKDGTIFPIIAYGAPIFKDGLVVGNRGTIVDITDRKRSEEILRLANERLTFHFQKTPMAYIEWDEDLKVIDWNPSAERIFGYSKSEAIGGHAFDLIVKSADRMAVESVWKSILKQTGGANITNENITKDGRTIVCEWYNTPLNDPNGNITGLASLVLDITERKRLEAELEKSLAILKLHYSETLEQVQTVSTELEIRKNELVKLQKENLQAQFNMLKNQVNPHFLFNSLNVLLSLIKLEPDLAESFTEQLSKVYRYVLENKEKELVSLATELEFMNAYVFLLNIRFQGKLFVHISLDESKFNYLIVPLALQLLIENAIKHNSFSKKNPLNIEIFIDENDYLNVSNNYQKRETQVESTGLGLQNIASRYAYFTEKPTFFGIEGLHYVARIPLLLNN